MAAGNIIAGIGVVLVVIFFALGMIATQTMLDNKVEIVMVDCYDKKSNVINEVTCTKELYHCNKFENLFNPKSCFKEELE